MNEDKLPLSLEEIEEYLDGELGDRIDEIKTERINNLSDEPMKLVWIRVDREDFHDAVSTISKIQTPYLSVASGSDRDDFIELIYHFQVNYSYPGKETTINLKVHLPKDDPKIPTITDIVPGAITTEREKQEMLGVEVIDIPDSRRLWLDEFYPKEKHAWRWDEKGMEDMSHYPHDPNEAPEVPTAENPRKGEEGGEEDAE